MTGDATAGGERRHRDTLAFVLAIVGATMWALFPVGNAMDRVTEDWTRALAAVVCAGALVGACAAATVWRQVELAAAAVSGGVTGAFVVAVARLPSFDTRALDLVELLLIGGSAAAAFVGAGLGRRARKARVSLAAAWLVMSSLSLVIVAAAIAEATGFESTDGPLGLFLLVAGVPGGIAATLLCPTFARRDLCSWLVVLAVASFTVTGLVAHGQRDAWSDAVVMGALIGALLAINAAIAIALVQLLPRRRDKPSVPPARVVNR